jgi:hypothetical protein
VRRKLKNENREVTGFHAVTNKGRMRLTWGKYLSPRREKVV